MKEYLETNPSEMLTLLLDGELESGKETALYSALADSEELRNEMHELLSIRESVNNDTEAFTPPPATTAALFNNLGFSSPTGNMPIENKPIEKVASTGFFQKIWAPALSAVIASCLTFIAVYNSFENEKINANLNESNQIEKKIAHVGSYESIANKNEKKNSSIVSKNDNKIADDNLFAKSDSDIIEKKSLISRKNESSYNESSSIVSDADNISHQIPIEYSTYRFQQAPILANSNGLHSTNIVSIPNSKGILSNSFSNNLKEIGLSLQFRGISASSFPEVSVADNNSLLSNINVAFLLKASETINIGLEFGSEHFSQMFYHSVRNSSMLYQQKPTVFWVGLAMKYSPEFYLNTIGGAQPYAMLNIGGSSLGPIGKAGLGLQYITNSGIGIMIGFEASKLWYDHQDNWYSSEKYGLTYGMSYSF